MTTIARLNKKLLEPVKTAAPVPRPPGGAFPGTLFGERAEQFALERALVSLEEARRADEERKAEATRNLDRELLAYLLWRESKPLVGKAEERRAAYENYRPLVRDQLRVFGQKLGGQIGRRLCRVSECGFLSKVTTCREHGPQSAGLVPCGDLLLCPYCAERNAEDLANHILTAAAERGSWSRLERETAYGCDAVAVKIPVGNAGDRGALNAIRRAEAKRWRGPGTKPRWVLGDDHVLLLFPPTRLIPAQKAYGAERCEKLSTAEVAERVRTSVISVHRRLRTLVEANELEQLVADPWIRDAGKPRTGGGKYARERMPWWGTAKERKRVQAEKKEQGEPEDRCCHRDHAGGERCGAELSTMASWLPTGAVLFTTEGVPPDWKVRRMVSRCRAARPFLAIGGAG